MKAIGYKRAGGSIVLEDIELPKMSAEGRDLCVHVKAISVNPVDYMLRSGKAPSPGEYKVFGYDAAGVVDSVGSDVKNFKVGDEVYYSGTVNRVGTNSAIAILNPHRFAAA